MEIMKRAYACEIKEINEQDRSIWFVASTEEEDRCGDIIRVAGWHFDSYDRNPVFLWAHDSSSLPIGKCIERKIEPGRLLMKIQFATAEENPLAEQTFRLYKGGFLSAVSVGFKPLKRSPIHPEDRWGDLGWEFIEQELLELSGVPVPANASALQLMMKGLDAGTIIVNGEPFYLSPEQRAALPALVPLDGSEEFAVGISMTKEEHAALKMFGDEPARWVDALDKYQKEVERLNFNSQEKKLGKGKRQQLEDIAGKMDAQYKALAGACDDLIEKCHGKLRKMLDDMTPEEDLPEDMPPKAFDSDAFIAALTEELAARTATTPEVSRIALLKAIQELMNP